MAQVYNIMYVETNTSLMKLLIFPLGIFYCRGDNESVQFIVSNDVGSYSITYILFHEWLW